MKRNIVLVVSALALVGCFNSRQHSNYPFGDPQGVSESSSATSTTTASTATAAITAPPAQQQVAVQQPMPVVAQQPRPPQVQINRLGSVVMYETTTQAPDNMSLHLFNTRSLYACPVSPVVNGEPVFKLRQGNFQQDMMPAQPGWNIPCLAVIMPNLSRSSKTAPSIWLSVKYPGEFSLTVLFLTFSGTSPQVIPQATYGTGPLQFPNIASTNGACSWDNNLGCLYNIFPQAKAEDVGDKLFAMLINGTVSLPNNPLFPPDTQLAMLMSTPDKQLAILR